MTDHARKQPRRSLRTQRNILFFAAVFAVSAVASGRVTAQIRYATGQDVVPVFASTTVRFSAPGTYVLRAYADDGILVAAKDVPVTVTAGAAR